MSPVSATAPPVPAGPGSWEGTFSADAPAGCGTSGGYRGGVAAVAEIEKLAREKLGIERLHPGQLEAIEAVLDGRDTLAVMSTGYGKSAIYQLAGELLGKPTIVVSPLIALQRDQVEAIEDRIGDGEAAELNSTVSARQAPRADRGARAGRARVRPARPRAARQTGGAGGAGGDRALAAGRRRGPLHQRVGARLPPRLPAAGRLRRAARPADDPGPDRDRLSPGPPRDRRAPRHAGPGPGDPRLRPSQPPLRGAPLHRGEGERGGAGRGGRRGAEARHRLHRHAQGERGAGRGARRRRGQGRGLPRGARRRSTAASSRTASWPTRSR